MKRVAAVTLLCVALATAAVADETPRDLATRGVETYSLALEMEEREARLAGFASAERLFARAAETGGAGADLYVNLGNAALQAEHLGRAVLAYRRALALDPGNPRALQNLEHARSLLPAWVPRPEPAGPVDSFFFWQRALPRGARSLAAAGCFAAAALLVAGGLASRRSGLRNLAWLPGLVWVALVASLVFDSAEETSRDAVVVAEEAIARAADSFLSPRAFPDPLPGGVEVRVLESRSPWLRARLANGRDAWVSESTLEPVTAPPDAQPR